MDKNADIVAAMEEDDVVPDAPPSASVSTSMRSRWSRSER